MAEDVIIGRIAVKVMPDTDDFRKELKHDLNEIEKSLKDIKIGVKLDSARVSAEAKKLNQELERSLKNQTIRVNLDNEASLRAAISRVRRQLDDLGSTTIPLKADEDGLKGQLKDFQQHLGEVGRLRLRVDPESETSLKKAIGQIDAELARQRELAVNVKLDKASLEQTRQELDRRIQTRIDAQIALDNASYARVRAEIKKFTDGIVIKPGMDDREVRAKLREIERTIEALDDKKIELSAAVKDSDKRQVERDINDLEDKLQKLKGEIQLRVKEKDKLQVGASLAVLVRDRVVKIVPELSKTAAANVVATLAALSGARGIQHIFEGLWESIKNLDKAAPIIGGIALAVANLGSVGIASASSLASLASSLASIGPAALTLPGILGGLALGVTASALALKDINKYLPEFAIGLGRAQTAGQAWKKLQDSISEAFWAKFAKPLRELVESLFPQFSAGMVKIGGELGGFFAQLAAGFKGVFDGALAGMFNDLAVSITIASTATASLANIVKILGETGAGYLPRLAQWFADVTNRLSAFLTTAAEGGKNSQLNQWIDTAIQALTDLGRVVVAVGGILHGLGKAANAAGGSTLATLADTLKHVSDVINSANFQASLVDVFVAAHTAIDQLTSQSGPALQRFLTVLAGTLQTILPMAGDALGKLLGGVADALAQPAFQGGLVDLFQGIANAVVALTPALGPLGQALGSIGSLLGTFLTALAPNLATALTAVATGVSAVTPVLQPLLTLLGQGLAVVLAQVVPLVTRFGQAISEAISGSALAGLVQQGQALVQVWASIGPLLGNVLVSAVKALTSIIVLLVKAIMQIGAALGPLMQQMLPLIGPLLEAIGTTVGRLVAALGPFLAKVVEIAAAVIGPLQTALVPLVTEHLPQLGAAVARLIEALQPLLDMIKKIVDWLMPTLVPAIKMVAGILLDVLVVAFNFVVDVVKAAIKIIQGVWEVFAGIFTGDWSRVWGGIKDILVGVWDVIVALLKGVWQIVLSIFSNAGVDLSAKWTALWNGVQNLASRVWNWLTSTWSTITSAITSVGSRAWQAVTSAFDTMGESLQSIATSAWDAVKGAFTTGVNLAIFIVRDLPGKVVAALGDLGSKLVSAGKKLIQGFIDGIKAMFSDVKATLSDLTSKLTSWKGPPSTDARLLTSAGQLVIDSFIDGLESRYDAVKRSLRGLSADIGGMTIDAPAIRAASSALTASITSALDAGTTGGVTQKILNYYAAPGSSIDSEEDLFAATGRARMVGW